MASMLWTDEESRYVRAIFKWQDRLKGDRASMAWSRATAAQTNAGELRVLLIGPKGVGKTAILTRFCDASFREDAAPDVRFERGGRRTLAIDGKTYTMDVLEMPSHIWPESGAGQGEDIDDDDSKKRNKKKRKRQGKEKEKGEDDTFLLASPAAMMLEQALAITEAAIVVYDITDDVSFLHARRLYSYLLQRQQKMSEDSVTDLSPDGQRDKIDSSILRICFRKQRQQNRLRKQLINTAATQNHRRSYALLLVGNKNDADDGERSVAWADGRRAAATLKEEITTTTPTATISPIAGTTATRNVLRKPPPWAAEMAATTVTTTTTVTTGFPQPPLSLADRKSVV